MQTQELLERRELTELCEHFVALADTTEIEFLRNALADWAREYPMADHDEELTIVDSFRRAARAYYCQGQTV